MSATPKAGLICSCSAGDGRVGRKSRPFNLAIDRKPRAADPVRLGVGDVCSGTCVRKRAGIVQNRTGHPLQFEIKVTRSPSRASLPNGRLSAPTTPSKVARFLDPSFQATPCTHCSSVAQGNRFERVWLRNALAAALQNYTDMQENGQLGAVKLLPRRARPEIRSLSWRGAGGYPSSHRADRVAGTWRMVERRPGAPYRSFDLSSDVPKAGVGLVSFRRWQLRAGAAHPRTQFLAKI